MNSGEELSRALTRIRANAPAGFAIGLHIRYSAPRYMFQAYPRDWLDRYAREAMLLQDPTVHWGFANTGAVLWRDLVAIDRHSVLARAAEHGLVHGTTVALLEDGSRSIASFARADRDPTADEIACLGEDLAALHGLTRTMERLSPAMDEVLRRLSVIFTYG